jgi:bifunctional UDP-N-acetylglucosamine pyrophosphorylase/glucosamine-1-phosphate N-acetyltransferase
VHLGNFRGDQKSVIGAGSKAGHCRISAMPRSAKKVNIGAGTITCNYDGTEKHRR